MKKLIVIALFFLTALTAFGQEHQVAFKSGNQRTFMKRAQQFIDSTRSEYPNFTNEEWDYSFDEYKAMVEEYRDNLSRFSDEEKSLFTRLRGEYVGFATKAGATKVANGAQKLFKSVSPFFEGLVGSIKDTMPDKE